MTVRMFVNERPVEVHEGCDILEAVSLSDEKLGVALKAGRAYLTDGVGLRLDPSQPASQGAIVRVVLSARRSPRDGSSA